MEKIKPAEAADGATAGSSSTATPAAATPSASGTSQLAARTPGLASASRPPLNEGHVDAVMILCRI